MIFSRSNISLSAAVLLLILTNILTFVCINNFSKSIGWQFHTVDVLDKLSELNAIIATAESEEMNFCLTKNKLLKDRCINSVSKFETQILVLLEITLDNPLQTERFNAMKLLLNSLKKNILKGVSISETKGHDEVVKFLNENDNQIIKNKIQELQRLAGEQETMLLAKRTENRDRSFIITIIIMISSYLLALTLVIISFNLIKKQLKIVQTKEAEFIELIESMPDALIIVDESGKILSANKQTEIIFGYNRGEIIGNPVRTLIPDADKFREQYLDNRRLLRIDLEGITSSQKTFLAEMYLSSYLDNGNLRLIKIIRDITWRKEMELELMRANKELEQFSYIASHDLKAPLRGISNLALWITEDFGDKIGEEGKEKLRLMRDRIDRMNSLIDGILQYSRVGRMYLDKNKIKLNDLIANVIGSLDKQKFNIAVSNMPEIVGNEIMLFQLFENLIGNAIKHHTRDDGNIKVTVENVGKFYKFGVIDDGPGIDPLFHNKLFIMFSTLDKKGTGVGLALCKKIVELVGGKIWVESKLGNGAKFFFTWPKY